VNLSRFTWKSVFQLAVVLAMLRLRLSWKSKGFRASRMTFSVFFLTKGSFSSFCWSSSIVFDIEVETEGSAWLNRSYSGGTNIWY
jgi:hypothetical protein